MIRKVLNIIDNNFMKVDVLEGVRRVIDAFYEKNIECFAAYENEKLAGIITKKELIYAHPNRISADVMSNKYRCVDCSTYIWRIKEMFDLNTDIDVIFVEEKNDIKGFVTRTMLNIELGKHVDLLTGLYKSDYIFYNAYKLIKDGKEASVIFIDLNNFGYIDKKYGHINGDIILKNVAKIIKESITPDTYLCRYAGDEFAVLTPYCIDESRLLAEKITGAIREFDFPNKISVSASVGIAGYGSCNNNIENILDVINKLINVASLASTKAKKNSDNSIVVTDVDINAIA